jgi:hypothetical protein
VEAVVEREPIWVSEEAQLVLEQMLEDQFGMFNTTTRVLVPFLIYPHRIPAAANGVYGYKPTFGILPLLKYATAN